MPSCRWTCLITAASGIGVAFLGTAVSAFQFPPLSDDINTRHIHRPEAWVGGGFQSSGPINQQPADFGPALGMRQRTANGNPASGDSFQNMSPGSLPGGLSRDGFGINGMRQSLNSAGSMANGQQYNNGQSPTGQNGFGQNGRDQNSNNNSLGPNGGFDQSQFGPNGPMPSGMNAAGQNAPPGWNPYGPPPMDGRARLKPKVSWAFESSQPPYVGLLGQVAKPGVYEIERRGTLLSDLVQNVGGMAKDASGQFRIIRNGRPGQSTSYAGASNFELMAGDLVVADARPAQYHQGSAKETADSVQVGFVNLLDRPVVLKLRVEHARLPEILSMMRQDPSLASQVKVVAPLGQRGYGGQAHTDATLASETVLIFPPNSVKTDRLTSLPQPTKIQRDGDKPAAPDEVVKPAAPADNITPDVTAAPRRQPSRGSWTESAPLPQSAQPVSQPNVEPTDDATEVPPPPEERLKPQRDTGIRGSSQRAASAPDRIARDTHMVLAPPAEEPAPNPDVVVHDAAPAPDIQESSPFTDEPLGDEPPRLNAKGKSQSMRLAKESSGTTLTSADLEAAAEPAPSSWSIWPPILTAGIGLITLLGFSLSLRRRTQAAVPNVPMERTPPQPVATNSQPVATNPQPVATNPQPAPTAHRRALLDEIIDDQLPLTEEQIPLASPMQFHGRPQPPKNIRMDQRHPLPKPHTPSIAGASSRTQFVAASEVSETEAPRTARSSLKPTYRIDRRGATGTASKKVVPTEPKSAKPSTGGPLDRALSAVQKREERDA